MPSMNKASAPTPGSRVRIISTSDPYSSLREGDEGTVEMIDSLGTVHVSWDSVVPRRVV